MITDFSAQPKPQNNNAKIVMWVFFALSAVAFIVSANIPIYKGVVGAVALASIVTAILMYTKYVSVKFYYDVIATGVSEPLFVVRQLVGKREVTLARIALADITEINFETKAERKAHKRDYRTNLYVYAPTLAPAVSYRMYVRSYSEKSELVLEGSDEFFKKILEFSAEAREMRAIDDEF